MWPLALLLSVLVGFNDNATLTGDLTPVQDARLLARTGADTSRVTVDWTYAEQGQGNVDLSLWDPIVREHVARGVRPILILMGSPRWAWPRWVMCPRRVTCHFPPDRTKDAAWARFAAAVAARYPDARAIEVWNEPNLSGFWGGAPDPARYTDLLRLTRRAVEEVRPDLPVLGASLAPPGHREFLRGMYASGARGLMDGISVHPYSGARFAGATYEMLGAVTEERDAAGDTAPLWITEIGFSTHGDLPEPLQAQALGDLLPRLMRRPQVRAVLVHTLADPKRFHPGREGGFGVIGKSAECAVAAAYGGRPCAWTPMGAQAKARFDAQEQVQVAIEQLQARRRRTGSYGPGDAARVCRGRFCAEIVHGGPWRFVTEAGDPW